MIQLMVHSVELWTFWLRKTWIIKLCKQPQSWVSSSLKWTVWSSCVFVQSRLLTQPGFNGLAEKITWFTFFCISSFWLIKNATVPTGQKSETRGVSVWTEAQNHLHQIWIQMIQIGASGWTMSTRPPGFRFFPCSSVTVNMPVFLQCPRLAWPGWFAPGPTLPPAWAPQMDPAAAVPPTRCQRAPAAPALSTPLRTPLKWQRRTDWSSSNLYLQSSGSFCVHLDLSPDLMSADQSWHVINILPKNQNIS